MIDSTDLEQELMKWDDEAYKTGIELAKAEADYNSIKDQLNNVLANMMNNLKTEEKTESAKERVVRGTKEFQEFVKGLSHANSKFLLARALHNGAKLKWQTAQTLIYKRAGELRRLK